MTLHTTAARLRTVDLVYVALFSVLIAVCAWISIPATIPFTLQTFGIFAALTILGGRRGTAFWTRTSECGSGAGCPPTGAAALRRDWSFTSHSVPWPRRRRGWSPSLCQFRRRQSKKVRRAGARRTICYPSADSWPISSSRRDSP